MYGMCGLIMGIFYGKCKNIMEKITIHVAKCNAGFINLHPTAKQS